MPSRKSEAVSSSQWTESLAEDDACAWRKCGIVKNRISNVRMKGDLRRVRDIMTKIPSAANFSMRIAAIKTYQWRIGRSAGSDWFRSKSPPCLAQEWRDKDGAPSLRCFCATLGKFPAGVPS